MEGTPLFEKAAARLQSLENPLVVTHIDADGVSSGSIIIQTFGLLGKQADVLPIRQLDSSTAGLIDNDRDVVFVDLGSGQIEHTSKAANGLIIDHHRPRGTPERLVHLNPAYFNIDGSREVSSSGLAYLLSKQILGDDAAVFAPLATVGAVGDMQNTRDGMISLNRFAVSDGEGAGIIQTCRGLGFFGRETRELPLFLAYATDPYLPFLTGSFGACGDFLKSIGLSGNADWPTYHQLSEGERQKLVTALHIHGIKAGLSQWQLQRLVQTYYLFPREKKQTEFRDATEFSTLLNACGRHERAELALRIAAGERGDAYEEARRLLQKHRQLLREGIEELVSNGVVPVGTNLQFFKSEKIKPTLIGVVIGMVLGGRLVNPAKVTLGVARQEERLKISARTIPELVRSGVDLAVAMNEAAKFVGGEGGGHKIAAGATIEEAELNRFLGRLDSVIAAQRSGVEEKPK